MLFPR